MNKTKLQAEIEDDVNNQELLRTIADEIQIGGGWRGCTYNLIKSWYKHKGMRSVKEYEFKSFINQYDDDVEVMLKRLKAITSQKEL